MLWNSGHPADHVVTPEFVAYGSGAQLLQFTWLDNPLIGELPIEWNWLPDEFGGNTDAKLLHFTLGTPSFLEYADAPMASEWHREKIWRNIAPKKNLTDHSSWQWIQTSLEFRSTSKCAHRMSGQKTIWKLGLNETALFWAGLKRVQNPILSIGRKIAELRDQQDEFSNELAVCAIFKDEALYLQEWLTFHHGIGVDHFYLYNDASSDNFLEVLKPWIERGIVTVKYWPKKAQVAAYNHCIKKYRNQSRWIAFIDLDEFIFSPTGRDLPDVLTPYRATSAIFVYWVLFGSSGHLTRPTGSVIESYKHCLDSTHVDEDDFNHGVMSDKSDYVTGWSRDGKSIVNPRLVRKYNIHKPKKLWIGCTENENREPAKQRVDGQQLNYSVFRINHYWSKSIQELAAKVERGSICNPSRPQRDLDRWLAREKTLNVGRDETIQPIWKRVKSEKEKSTRPAS